MNSRIPGASEEHTVQLIKLQVDEINRRAMECLERQLNGADELAEKALSLASPNGIHAPVYPQGTAESLLLLGRYFLAKSDFAKALDHFQKSLHLYEIYGPINKEALSRSYLAVVYGHLGDYPQALEITQEALHTTESIEDHLLEAEILNDLSYLYVLTGDPQLALSTIEKSIQFFRTIHDTMRLSWALDTKGQAFLKIGQPQDALPCLLECIQLAEKDQRNFELIRWKQTTGDIFRALHQPENALNHYQQVLDLSHQMDTREYESSSLISIAELYQEQDRFTESIPFLQESLEIALEMGHKPQIRDCYRLLSIANKQNHDFQRALEYHEKYFEAENQLFNDMTDQRLKNLTIIYQLEAARKEAEVYHLRTKALEEEVEAQKHQQAFLEQLAMTDSLTCTLNRRAFMEMAEKAFNRSVERMESFALILIDADFFKQINDTYGHQVGDQTLALIADRLQNHIRPADRLGRYGGEEFIIMQPGADAKTSLIAARRLCGLFSDQPIHLSGMDLQITLSFGISAYNPKQGEMAFDELINQADQAMYRAKNSGRNGVAVYSDY
jgi:diguanylate cyclase (GGDEF)-like protein